MGTQHITPQNSLLPNVVNYPLVIDDVRGEGTRQEFILYRILKYCLVSSHTSPSCIANCLMHFNAYYDVSRLESRYFYRFDLRNRYMESVTRMHTLTHTHKNTHTHSHTHTYTHLYFSLDPHPTSTQLASARLKHPPTRVVARHATVKVT
jgi:hypothetical protein